MARRKNEFDSKLLIFLKRSPLFLGIAIPSVLIFKALLLPGPAVWGDAPFFYREGFKELLTPFLWTSRGEPLGGVNLLIWLSPIMSLYGVLGNIGLTNDVIVRLLFYFPGIIFSFLGSYLLSRYLKLDVLGQFFSTFFYGLNTYFLLLIDGGQVGVVLAYGLFPLTLYFAKKLIDQRNIVNFLSSLAVLFFLASADIRIAAIAFLTVFVWTIVEDFDRKAKLLSSFKILLLLLIIYSGLGAYWLVPTLFSQGSQFVVGDSGFQPMSILHSLTLFQPHWSSNEFGRISFPYFYFLALPFFIFAGLFKNNRNQFIYALLFLIFAFIAKGNAPPFGDLYAWAVNNLPFGSAFRDSSKFFAPLVLFGGLSVGMTVAFISDFVKYRIVKWGFLAITYSYLILLLAPAFVGQMDGVLETKVISNDFSLIKQQIIAGNEFFRTVWFPERHPFSFQTSLSPAIDAKSLISLRPFASLNVGTYDAFNFIHNHEFLDWFDLLGIKYLVFSGDPRKASFTDKEKEEWDTLLNTLAATPGLLKEEWDTKIPIYSMPSVKPKIFGVDQLFLVVGSDDVYEKLKKINGTFSVGSQAFLFLEDGKFHPSVLQEFAPESAVLVLNDKDETDLILSFLQHYFRSPKDNLTNQWALRDSGEYLKWKYEMLVRGVKTREFDYGKGFAFSTEKNESITFALDIPEDGQYIFAARVLKDGKFRWQLDEVDLKKGIFKKEFTNTGGLHAINTLALISQKDWAEASRLTQELEDRFETIKLGVTDESITRDILSHQKWSELPHKQISPVEYEFSEQPSTKWIIFADKYHSDWVLENTDSDVKRGSLPLYSVINGYSNHPNFKISKIVFSGQRDVGVGTRLSFLTLFILASFILWSYAKNRRKNSR